MSQLLMDLSVAILAGGNSRRMGRDKGLIDLDGRLSVEHVYRAARPLGVEIFMATNRPQEYDFLGLRMVSDRESGRGSLEGLRTALEAAQTQRVLVLACDMPLVQPELLAFMAGHATTAQALVPRFGGRLQPFLAVYSRSCLGPVEAALEDDELEVGAVLQRLKVEELTAAEVTRHDPQGMSFHNVNTPADLARARRILAATEP